MYTVYKHTAPNGKVYIGITSQKPEKRWQNGEGYKDQPYWYHAIRKYTWKNIKHEIVKDGLEKEEACGLEKKLIAKYHATNRDKGYNISTGGECGAAGVHPSAETRRKMSEALKGANNPMYGKHLSVETRRKMSESLKGKPPWIKGNRHSAEARRKMSESHKGKPSPRKGAILSMGTRQKLSEAHKGKHLSAEHRRKLSEAHKGKPSPLKGKHLSAETRRKMSESNKGKVAKAVICVETGTLYSSGMEAEKSTGVNRKSISNVLRGINKTAGGYHWKYAEDMEESK